MSNKKYYWLKLKEDFFDDDTIEWIEEQDNGKEYCLFYLKLCLKSLKSNGILVRNVGEMLVPYDVKKLAEMTKTDIDTVRVSMDLFTRIGLVQILENGEIYLTQLANMVGSETSKAQLMRNKRSRDKQLSDGNNVTNSLPKESNILENRYTEIEIEKELELDIESEKEREKEKENRPSSSSPSLIDVRFVKIRTFFDENIRVSTFSEHKKMYDLLDDYNDPQLIIEAIKLSGENGKPNLNYVTGILKNWKVEYGINTHEDWKVKMSAKSQSDNNQQSIRGNHGKNESSLDGFYKQLERDKQAWGG